MAGLAQLASEFAITVSSGEVWLSIGEALLFGGAALLLGTRVARMVGLLKADAPAGETLGVGLASGLMVLAAWWAAIWSGGRSSFTPVAIGLAVAITLAVVREVLRPSAADDLASARAEIDGDIQAAQPSRRRSLILTTLAGAAFVGAVALLYGSTMAPSPRGGVQPMEYMDEAFYSVLGRDLAVTGTETNIPPSGFQELDGVPPQTWYHWGELWLASAVITVFGAAPVAARYFVVLPVVLLAAAAMTGTLVRRVAGTVSWRAYGFGFVVCLFLAPVPWIYASYFSSFAVGLTFGITFYGLAAVAALVALYSVAVVGTRRPTWTLAAFVGSAAALILPAHLVIALLALFGGASVWTYRIAQSVKADRRLPVVLPVWRRTFLAAGVAMAATVAWGWITGHGLGTNGSVPSSVSPFNSSWGQSVAVTYLGAGPFLAIPIAWLTVRKRAPTQVDMYVGTMAILVAGAIAWGARLGEFNMFHMYFGGIAVFATPAAAIAVWVLLTRLREIRRLRLFGVVVVLCGAQLIVCAGLLLPRLQQFGPRADERITVILLDAIKQLPPDAKLAYACRPLDEISYVDSRLVSIDAHTGRRVVPMCFEADYFSTLVGAERSAQAPNSGLATAPQRVLYPNAAARPSSAAVAAFLKANGIDYIYADATRPNTLVADAVPIATSGDGEVLRIP